MPSENRFFIVGIGPGERDWRTLAAVEAIKAADFVVGYKPYLDLISDLLHGKKVFSSSMGKEVDRVKAAINLLEEGSVALVSSGDPNVYGMAGLGLELSPHPEKVEIVPGVTSFTAAACRAGLVFRECVAVISLSDLLTPWHDIEVRLRMAAETNMPVALYNPRSKRRDWQLIRALDICGQRDVLVARDVGREKEEIFWTSSCILRDDAALREKIDMTTLVIISGRGVFKGEARVESEMNVVGIGPGDPRTSNYRSGENFKKIKKDLRSRKISKSDRRSLSWRKDRPYRPVPGEDGGSLPRGQRHCKERSRSIYSHRRRPKHLQLWMEDLGSVERRYARTYLTRS